MIAKNKIKNSKKISDNLNISDNLTLKKSTILIYIFVAVLVVIIAVIAIKSSGSKISLGDTVTLEINRNGKTQELKVTLAEMPQNL